MPTDKQPPTLYRLVAVGLVWNSDRRLLVCKKPADRGVFPGQWGFPGGGIEPGETMTQALQRELREETGIEISRLAPAFFKDGFYHKVYPDGSQQPVYMIFLVFHCRAVSARVTLNHEFSEYRWVTETEVLDLDLNEISRDTLKRVGPWDSIDR